MRSPRLDVYVESGCVGCRRAVQVAAWVRVHFPSVKVRIINPGDDNSQQATLVRATPTYFLNGAEFSLGNPSEAQLEAALRPMLEGD